MFHELWVPCAIQQVLVGYSFWIQECVHDLPKLPNYPFPLATINLFSKSLSLCLFCNKSLTFLKNILIASIPSNCPHWSSQPPWIHHWGGAGRWGDVWSHIYGNDGTWAPGFGHQTHIHLTAATSSPTPTWTGSKEPNLIWNKGTALSSGWSGTSVSTPNCRVENAKHTWVWSLRKNKFGESWTQWGHGALFKNYFCQPSGCKWCLTKQRANTARSLLYFRTEIVRVATLRKNRQEMKPS